jgi:hypothetical protein
MARKRYPEARRPGPPIGGFRHKATSPRRGGPHTPRSRQQRMLVIAIMVLIAALLIKRAGTPPRIPSSFSRTAGSQHGH